MCWCCVGVEQAITNADTQEDRDMVGEKYLFKAKEKRMQTWGNLDHSEQLMSGHLTSGFRLPSGFGTDLV